MLAVYVAYVLGFRTKLAQLLAVVCLVSLDNRNLMLQNGGVVATNLLAVWTWIALSIVVAVVLATHNMDLAARMDRRVTLRDGLVVELP